MTTGPDLAQALTDALAEKESGSLGLCSACEQHPATTLSWVRLRGVWGDYRRICGCCAAVARLERARSMAAEIPKLEAALTKAKETCG